VLDSTDQGLEDALRPADLTRWPGGDDALSKFPV
jgi:hypothetical protein